MKFHLSSTYEKNEGLSGPNCEWTNVRNENNKYRKQEERGTDGRSLGDNSITKNQTKEGESEANSSRNRISVNSIDLVSVALWIHVDVTFHLCFELTAF
jgi:hypothetical protein